MKKKLSLVLLMTLLLNLGLSISYAAGDDNHPWDQPITDDNWRNIKPLVKPLADDNMPW